MKLKTKIISIFVAAVFGFSNVAISKETAESGLDWWTPPSKCEDPTWPLCRLK